MTPAQVIIARLEQRELLGLAERIARQYCVLLHDMLSPTRRSGPSSARQALWAALRHREEHWSYSRIGELFDKNHATIKAGVDAHEARVLMKTSGHAALIRIGQACVDWFQDTGDCHLCSVSNGKHDSDCPVGAYIGKSTEEKCA